MAFAAFFARADSENQATSPVEAIRVHLIAGILAHWHKDTKVGDMARVRLSVDIDAELKKRIKLAAVGSDQSVRAWIEQALTDALERQEDRGWMESDLSRLGEIDPYEFAEGDLEKGYPVEFVPGRGYVVIEEEREPDDGEQR